MERGRGEVRTLTCHLNAGLILCPYSKEVSGATMTTTHIGPKHQITIPQQAFKKLDLKVGDFFEVQVRGNTLHLVP